MTVRSAPATRAREPGRAAVHARAPPGAARRGRCRGDARIGFTREVMNLEPAEFAESYLRAIGVEVVVAGEDFRFGRRRAGDLALLERLGFGVVIAPEVAGVSSSRIRHALHEGDLAAAAGCSVVPRARRHRRQRRPARRHARLPDGEPAGRPEPARAAVRHLRGARRSATAPRSRSARIRTTAARSGASSRSCSTSTATSTAGGSSSSSGSACATRPSSIPSRRSSSRSAATSRGREPPGRRSDIRARERETGSGADRPRRLRARSATRRRSSGAPSPSVVRAGRRPRFARARPRRRPAPR